MKAQFKYSFKTGLSMRGIVFAIIAAMMLVFIVLGSFNLLPFAALVTAVSLGGVSIAVMVVFNIISDISIVRRMFAPPGAYLYALVPIHRGKTLFSSLITMLVLDLVTMAVVIYGEVHLSLMLAGRSVIDTVWGAITNSMTVESALFTVSFIALLMAGYLFVVMTIMLCLTMRRSVFSQVPAGGLLAFLTGCAVFYAFSLMQLVMIPFGTVHRYLWFISIEIGSSMRVALPVYALLLLIAAGGLFAATSKLMERKLSI